MTTALAPKLTYVGHATLLIEMDGVRFLTDPFLRERLAHLRRQCDPIGPHMYKNIDAVLISHLHLDHFDLPSLEMLDARTCFIVPAGAGDILREAGFQNVREMHTGEVAGISDIQIEATYASHSGFRPPFGPVVDSLGFLIRGSRTFYFAGDTDIFPEMATLADDLHVAFIPVWGWGPTLNGGHMDPQQAAESLRLLRPHCAVPIHWGTLYPIGLSWWRQHLLTDPPYEFADHAAQLAPEVEVRILTPGLSTSVDRELSG